MIADFSFGFECDVYELKLSFKTEWMAIKWWGPLWRLLGRNPVLRLICDWNVVRFACQNISGEEILHFTYLAGITLNFLNALAEKYLDLDLLDHWVISYQTWNLSPTCEAQLLNHSTSYTTFFLMKEHNLNAFCIICDSTVMWAKTTSIMIYHTSFLPIQLTCKSPDIFFY